jgi:hypothetical protein
MTSISTACGWMHGATISVRNIPRYFAFVRNWLRLHGLGWVGAENKGVDLVVGAKCGFALTLCEGPQERKSAGSLPAGPDDGLEQGVKQQQIPPLRCGMTTKRTGNDNGKCGWQLPLRGTTLCDESVKSGAPAFAAL